MKKITSLFILTGLAISVKAQTIPAPTRPAGSRYTDSVRIQQNAAGKQVLVNGSIMNSVMDIYENLLLSKSSSKFIAATRAAALPGTFKSRGPLTLLLPSDTAFSKKVTNARLDTLLKPAYKYELINLISYHVIAGRFTAKEISKQIKAGNGEASLLTLAGSKITARIDENRNIILQDETGGKSLIRQFDIEQSNGILHTITEVLVPKYKAL